MSRSSPSSPALEKSDEVFRLHADAPTPRIRYRLKPGRIGRRHPLRQSVLRGHRRALLSRTSPALKREGKIPAHCRFQIDLVPAHSVIWLFLQDDLHAPVDPIYNEALKREIDKIAARLPHDQIAIQFDVASAVFARLERNDASTYGGDQAEMQETFAAS